MFVNDDRACGAAGIVGSTPTDVPGAAEDALGELKLTRVSEGRGEASGSSSHWCGAFGDPRSASEAAGEDEGWMIQSLIENAEVDALRSASTTQKSSSGAGEHRKRAGDRAFKVGGRGESKNRGWSLRTGSSSMGITKLST
jgi:hypothetical protein